MALTIAPSGLRPARKKGAGYNNNGLNTYRVANAVPNAIFHGDPVGVSLGTVEHVSVGVPTAKVAGVFQGASWVDPVSGRKIWSNYIPAATSAKSGDIEALVVDDPNQTFYVWADASISAGDVGLNFNATCSGNGSTQTGMSNLVLDASSRTAGSAIFQLVGIAKVPDNAYGDPTPLCEVIIKQHIDHYVSAANA